MVDPSRSQSSPPAPQEDAPPNESNLAIKIVLGVGFVLALIVIIIQLGMSDVFTKSEAAAVTKDPASSSSQRDQPAVPPEYLASPKSGESKAIQQQARTIVERLGNDTTSLLGIIAELSDRLDLVEKELTGTRALYATAARKVGKLELEAANARLQAEEIKTLGAQLAESLALLDIAERRSKALMDKLATSPNPEMLREARAMRDTYEAELRATKMRLARDVAEKERLRADLASASRELAATETALESTTLFIESIDLLPKAAKQLFLELSRLETVSGAELAKNYRLIEEKLGARAVDKISFATGSAEVNAAKTASIRAAMERGKSDSFFLVIGYASKTGNFDINKKLSSARATAVGTLAVAAAKPNQRVRAVFLGQTDRFSTKSVLEDQICELWEIPK